MFKGCWHCGAEDHPRSGGKDGKGKKCLEFSKLLERHNPGVKERKLMKLPEGYKGAYEKAQEAAGIKPKKRLNMLGDEDVEDSESDFESPVIPGRMCALRGRGERAMESALKQAEDFPDDWPALNKTRIARDEIDPDRPPPTHWSKYAAACKPPEAIQVDNSYAALAEEELTLSADEISHLNGWASKVSKKSRSTGKTVVVPKPADHVVIKSEKELDALLSKRPDIAAISGTEQKVRKLLESLPDELVCGPNEVLCLVDSGSTVNAAWIKKHFPQFAHLVEETLASRRGDSATTACGKKLYNKGRCVVYVHADDQPFPVAFKDMEVEMPILSVRKMVKRGNDIDFRKGGGFIRNRNNGKTVRFHEYEGVYYLKLRVENPADVVNIMGFPRPGP